MVLCMFLASAPVTGRAFQAVFNFTCVHMHAFTCVHGGVGGGDKVLAHGARTNRRKIVFPNQK